MQVSLHSVSALQKAVSVVMAAVKKGGFCSDDSWGFSGTMSSSGCHLGGFVSNKSLWFFLSRADETEIKCLFRRFLFH